MARNFIFYAVAILLIASVAFGSDTGLKEQSTVGGHSNTIDNDSFDKATAIRGELKWQQLPDLDQTGMDVAGTCPGFTGQCDVLADDFLCEQTGRITEIHIYGSWFEDMYPYGDPGAVMFVLSIHADVPAGVDAPWSHPGELLWMRQFNPGDFNYSMHAAGLLEGFYDPAQQFYIPMSDYTCWEYVFVIESDQFIQQGTPGEPVIYWLDVQAFPEGESYFGWKTSTDHWNDDATWYPGMEPAPPVPMLWEEMRYPYDHPWAGMSIDLAFEIYAVPENLKWNQRPDLNQTGMDVAGTCPGFTGQCDILADDFLCDETGAITEIRIYGSWFEDMYPYGDPGAVTFVLSIHTDVPAGVDAPWSHPGDLLWLHQFNPGDFTYSAFATGLLEGFYDPVMDFYIPMSDYTCWEYVFVIDQVDPFIQEGSPQSPVVYWLDVQAFPEGESYFGWKTSIDHWNDDATWYPGTEPVPAVPMLWEEMRYPYNHPWVGTSIDLAFKIYSEGQPCDCNPGDANDDGTLNVADPVYLIDYIFKGGPAPVPYALCSGDADCDCTVNIADAVYLINYIFKGGASPCTCEEWLSRCGPPLRK